MRPGSYGTFVEALLDSRGSAGIPVPPHSSFTLYCFS